MTSSLPCTVLIVIPRWAHVMDVAGPAQAFTHASEQGARYAVRYVADQPSTPVHQGLLLSTETAWPKLSPEDLVIVAGWRQERCPDPLSPELLDRVRDHAQRGGRVASVCSGALLLARIGILQGLPATTHHTLAEELARTAGVRVVDDVLYTCSGNIHTSAGIASGIDLSLHLIAHDCGPALAARVARTLVVSAARAGGQSQDSIMLRHRAHMDDLVHRAQDLLDDPQGRPLSLEQLGSKMGVSGRTLARHFEAAVGMTPHRYAAAVRQERAGQLRQKGWSADAAAAAVGYADGRSLRSRG